MQAYLIRPHLPGGHLHYIFKKPVCLALALGLKHQRCKIGLGLHIDGGLIEIWLHNLLGPLIGLGLNQHVEERFDHDAISRSPAVETLQLPNGKIKIAALLKLPGFLDLPIALTRTKVLGSDGRCGNDN